MVTVTSAKPKSPSLFPLISSGTSQERTTTIGCLAKDFLPESIDFSFVDQVSNNYSNGFKKYNSVLQSGGTYSACSQIKVPTQGWQNSDSYYCNAKHLDKTISALLQLPKVIGKKPIVTIHPPMKDDVELSGSGRVICFASEFYPKNIQISWKKNSEVIHDAVTEEAVSNGNGTFMITSYIKVSKQDWDTDSTFSCIVTHDASDFHETKNVSKSTVCDQEIITDGNIKVTAVPPSFETIYMQNIAPLTCIITNMANKDGLEVTWYANNEKINNTIIEDPLYDSLIRRYTAKAIATVCPEDWKTKIFNCSVSHPELPRIEVVTIKKPNGNEAKAPIVLLYPPHPDELAKRESATMACLVKGFNPPDIFVKWMDSNNEEQFNVATTGPIQEISSSSKKTYTLLSTLTLSSVQDWNSGKSYTCIVGHESLPLHTTQRTIDKTSVNASPGKLLPLLPCCDVLDTSTLVTVGCLLKDAYPSKKIEMKPENIYKNISIVISSDKASLRAIFMSITVSDWGKNRITCTSQNNTSVILTNSYCKNAYEGKSNIEVLLPSCGIKPEDNVVPVACLVSNLKGHVGPLQWLKNGSPFETDNSFKPLKGDGGFFFGRGSLNISKESWNKEDEYTCQVKFMTENYIKNISKCSACQPIFVTPTVEVELPSREDFLNGNATITCSILGTSSDASQVYLMLDGKNSEKKVTTVQTGDNQRVKHSYKVTDKEWEVIKEIICGVKQPCSMPDVHAKINKPLENIKPKPPTISILASCCDGNEAGMVTLVCTISDFWPQNILVKWLQNGSLHKSDTASVLKMLDRNGNYFATSTLKVPRESWYKEELYTCEVTHQMETFRGNISICIACQSIFATPTVEVELPSREDFLNDNATITCSILGTKPDASQVYLMFDGKKSNKSSITVHNGNNQRVKHSYKVTDKEWEPIKEISCVVKQPCSMSDVHVKVNKTLEDIKPKSPSINILASCCDGNDAGMVTLVCTISNFWPQNILVNWLQNGSTYKEDTASVLQMLDRNGNYFATSTLKVPRESWYKEESYTCKVTHQKKTFQANISTGICKDHFSLPDGYIQKPSFKDLFLLKSANVSCKTNLPYVDIHWMLNGKEKISEYNKEKKKPGNLSWIESTLEISLEEWKIVSNVSCKLHPPNNVLQEKMTITRSNDPSVIKAPRVYVLVTNAENGTEEDQLSLICLVKAFYPEDIFVTWNVNDTIIKEDVPNSEDVACDHKSQQCSFVSHLSISKEDWVAGRIYICQVAHISSELYYIKNISNSNGETTHPKKPLSTDNSSVYHDDGGEDLNDSEEITNIWMTSSTFIALFLLTLIYSGCVTFVKVK